MLCRSGPIHSQIQTLPPLQTPAITSFDLRCNVPFLKDSFIKRVEDQHLHYDPASSVRVIIDIEAGFALHELETMDRADVSLIVVTFGCCPEYWEDLWDLHPDVLIVDSTYDSDLASAVVRARRGEKYRQLPKLTSCLSKQERKMLRHLAMGWSNKRIALQLHVQEKTILNSLTSVYSKLHVENRTHALLYYWGISGHAA